ncbi:aldehyde dehydrogenase family protein [Natronospirillum operosum]|uniref:Aldehyde dehydrogenase family protein n=1 Tax=Natronospirillum operosum TaxID=2759953 RepID=A0A4Z0WBY7_9GAMM|nr:benzaldehyde dehydrogenase [Natronospirillum operosum]TGG95672.1 aldehyde dehydrogenase family protein [Natronospirillum operosum]
MSVFTETHEYKWQNNIFTGEWVSASGGGRNEVLEPATEQVLTTTGLASGNDVQLACARAAETQQDWVKHTPRERSAIFLKAARFLEDNAEELALLIARETGGIIPKGQHEVKEAAFILQLASSIAVEADGHTLASTPDRQSYAKRLPLGVVGVISPFNFPLILSTRAVVPALAMGNAVVSKPDTQTPLSGGMLLALALEEAGLPQGVYQVLPGGADAGEALCTAPEVAMVAFTGSTDTGRKVGELCGRNLKKVSLELGGKSPLIILADADLDVAASNIAWGAYFHQGQICMASGRVLVHESIADELAQKLVEKARHLPVGDPVSGQVALGPLINRRQVERVHAIVHDSVKAGAVLQAGGEYKGLFYQPTVLSGVKPGMRAYEEEVFGPVINLTTFKTDDEAVRVANDTEYGLAGAVISADLARAQAIGAQLKVGMLHINDQTINDECTNPFGGCGQSGNGHAVGSISDWDTYTHWQWVTVKQAATPYPF